MPGTVLKASKLVRAPEGYDRYLPSITTKGFADDVVKLADDVDRVQSGVKGDASGTELDSSLSNLRSLEHKNLSPARSHTG